MRQLELFAGPWGGRRRGAGRKKRRGGKQAHAKRPRLNGREPLHVTMKTDVGAFGGSLRDSGTLAVVLGCIDAAKERFGMRIVHYSVQSNHIHLIVEVEDEGALTRGMRGLSTRLARNLNRHWGRRGALFVDRYHAAAIRSPRQMRNVLAYVCSNDLRHGCSYHFTPFDPCSSAAAFDGWLEGDLSRYAMDEHFLFALEPPVVAPRTWLLRHGWRLAPGGRQAPPPSIQRVPVGGETGAGRRLVLRV